MALEDRLHGEKPPPIDVGPKRLGRIADIYPKAASFEGWEGFVYVIVGVDERGTAQDAQPLIAQPTGKFYAATVEAMLRLAVGACDRRRQAGSRPCVRADDVPVRHDRRQ